MINNEYINSIRINNSISARDHMQIDFFGGWKPEDILLFSKYKCNADAEVGFLIDFFGAKTPLECVPWASSSGNIVIDNPPIPDDGVRAEAIEYFALLSALESSTSSSFSFIELGASYAPWSSLAALLAMRKDKKHINITAVEAAKYFRPLIEKNFNSNGLNDYANTNCNIILNIINVAVGLKRGTAFFPMVGDASENGGQLVSENTKFDYVGRDIEHEEVQVVTLADIIGDQSYINLLHCDIQGAEAYVIPSNAGLLTQKVKHLFVGTHSRHIEGIIIECLHNHGWELLRERPTTFDFKMNIQSPVGMTTRDGGQFWINHGL